MVNLKHVIAIKNGCDTKEIILTNDEYIALKEQIAAADADTLELPFIKIDGGAKDNKSDFEDMVHALFDELSRSTDGHVYGRRCDDDK